MTIHPDDVFHVIIDALAMIAKMSPEDLARYNAGRPPWDWYDDVDATDPKTTRDGWMAVLAEARAFATRVLDHGDAETMLGTMLPEVT